MKKQNETKTDVKPINKQLNKLLKKYEKEIVVLIAIQKEGIAQVSDIVEKANEWGVKLAPKEVKDLAERLRRKDLLSIILERQGDVSIEKYALNKVKNVPPVAHYRDIVDNEDGIELIKYLDDQKGVNKGREPDIKNYWTADITWKVKEGCQIFGFIPNENEVKAFYRTRSGELLFKPLHFRNYLRDNFRLVNKPESQSEYLSFDIGKVKINGMPMKVESTYVTVGGAGRGETKWESLQEGTEITTSATIPETIFSATDFERFLKIVTKHGLVGFGGWGKRNTNNLELVDFQFNGRLM